MWKKIFLTTLIAGLLDITAASIQTYVGHGLTPDIVLKFIASGVFGKVAYSGIIAYMLFGLAIHFLIVFACTVVYFFSYPKIRLLQKNIYLSVPTVAAMDRISSEFFVYDDLFQCAPGRSSSRLDIIWGLCHPTDH